MFRRVDFQQKALHTALVETDAPLGVADQFIFRLLQLEIVHVEAPVHRAAVEDELVGGDGEEGAGQLPDASSKFCEDMMREDSFFRTRLRVLRMYSMVVRLDSQMYSSSRAATVFPSVRSLSLR